MGWMPWAASATSTMARVIMRGDVVFGVDEAERIGGAFADEFYIAVSRGEQSNEAEGEIFIA